MYIIKPLINHHAVAQSLRNQRLISTPMSGLVSPIVPTHTTSRTHLTFTASYQIYALKPNSTQHDSTRATTIADQPNPLLNWWDAYPKPTSTDSLPRISIEDVAAVMRNPDSRAMQDYAIIDVRRNDHAVS